MFGTGYPTCLGARACHAYFERSSARNWATTPSGFSKHSPASYRCAIFAPWKRNAPSLT
jgi:hypothetical protein